ncbi:flagellar filament capping protein FliD [Lysinibacillus endophyticus]|uniref:flagellar filament capping protein FliD n=1 Tax=Ureibacillus endophyticus TaxID=1978490 RepID=UPI0020A07252|nr:flagellar filament capping protein FliD [Lysinibacillus endophyticus]MCP1143753.1 flagellar filament capping protein FliD [Lysinibacillus endophyticus]
MATTRIGGLASGMDIDSLVEKLMQTERAPLDKLEQKKQTYEWQRDAYREVNTKLQTLDTYIADNLVIKSINSKTATSSNPDRVGVVATSSAAGNVSIEGVSQLAVAARALGKQVNAVGTTKMKDLLGETGSFSIELKAIQNNGEMPDKYTKIEFTGDMTVNQFVSKVNSSNAGVTLVFENGRFSLTAKNTGDNKAGAEIEIGENSIEIFNDLGFNAGSVDTPKSILTTEGKNAIFLVNGIATERSTNTFTISGYNVTLKETFNEIQTITQKYNAALTERTKAKENLTNKSEQRIDALNNYYTTAEERDKKPSFTEVHNKAYTDAFGGPANTLTLSEQEKYNKLGSNFWKELTPVETNFISSITSEDADEIRNAIKTNNSLSDNSKKKLEALTDDQLVTFSKVTQAEINERFKPQADWDTLKNEEKQEKDPDRVKADELKSKYNLLGDTFFNDLKIDGIDEISIISEIDFALENAISEIEDDNLRAKLEKLSQSQIEALDSLSKEDLTNFKKLAEQNVARKDYLNSEEEYKAAETRVTNAENTVKVTKAAVKEAKIPLKSNGTIDQDADVYKDLKTEPAVTMTYSTNVDDIVNRIKEFVTTYNGLITDLYNLTTETKYRDYQPLTNPQKEAMEEKQIELWEKKAKSGILRGDTIIRNGLSSMRSLVYQSNPAVDNVKYNTLYSIGITTSSNYNSGGTLQIDETKLRQALEEDPDAVSKLLSYPSGKEKDTMVINGVTKEVDTRGLAQKLRGEMSKIKSKIEERAGRSTMSETQYTLGKYLRDVDNSIKTWQDKLADLETRYWKQFTAMETAINKANQQYTSLSSYFS